MRHNDRPPGCRAPPGLSPEGASGDESRKTWGDLRPRPPLYGIWNVEEYAVDGKARPPLLTDEGRWRRVVFLHPQLLAIQHMNDSRQRYLLELNANEHTLSLSKQGDKVWKATLTYRETGPDRVVLEGTLDGQPVRAELRRVDETQFLLVNRGFHWINEYPFNR